MTSAIIIKHPLVQDKLTIMRNKKTDCAMFRMLSNELSHLLAYEATKDLNTYEQEIEILSGSKHQFAMVHSRNIVVVSIMRAGNGMLDGVLELMPTALVGHIGLYRDPKTMSVIEYYYKMPAKLEDKTVIILDPMIATGYSAATAISRIKESNVKNIIFLSIVASQIGIDYLFNNHPDIKLYTAAVDPKLDDKKYIVPGLGDAGNRMYGTI